MLIKEMEVHQIEMFNDTVNIMLSNPEQHESDNCHGEMYVISKSDFIEWAKITNRLSQVMAESLNAYNRAVRKSECESYQALIHADWGTDEKAEKSSIKHLIEGLEVHDSTSLTILFDYLQYTQDRDLILNYKQK